MFEVDTLVASCRSSLAEPEPRRAVHEILVETLERTDWVAEQLGRSEGGLEVLFNSPELTVLNVVWAPRMSLYPHDHRMWAVIGIYGGGEDNTLFRRGSEGLVESGGKASAKERRLLWAQRQSIQFRTPCSASLGPSMSTVATSSTSLEVSGTRRPLKSSPTMPRRSAGFSLRRTPPGPRKLENRVASGPSSHSQKGPSR